MEQTCDVLKIILHDHLTAPPEFVHVYLGGVVYREFRWNSALGLGNHALCLFEHSRHRKNFFSFLFAAMNFVASDNKKTNLRCKTEVC